MPDVIVVGAGLAGMSAAHRLLERGYNVTLIEQNAFLGGKLGAHQDTASTDWHEHCYHMYLNWYHNFWTFMDEIGARRKFVPQPEVHCLRPGEFGNTLSIANVGSPWTYWRNIMSGVESPSDTLISMISLADLVGQPDQPNRPDDLLERTSVYGFLASRPYSTQGAIENAGRTLAEAFASPSYLSSARSYRSLIRYGARLPDPMMWLLAENTETGIFIPWGSRLQKIAKGKEAGKLEIRTLTRVNGLEVVDGRIAALRLSELNVSPTIDTAEKVDETSLPNLPVENEVILAVPLQALYSLLSPKVLDLAPNLVNVRRLRCEAMISLDVYFNRRIPNVPKGITVLLESRHNLSFLDNSQIWQGVDDTTKLNVIASDCDTLVEYGKVPPKTEQLKIEQLMLRELSRFLQFDPVKDVARCHLQTNVGEELFVNQVGSWEFRPRTSCGIPNLFIAGDYCRTFVDVVTVEGAVVSGLMAAEAIRRRHNIGSPIEIRRPDAFPTLAMAAFAAAQMPTAFAAQAVSTADRALKSGFKRVFPNG